MKARILLQLLLLLSVVLLCYGQDNMDKGSGDDDDNDNNEFKGGDDNGDDGDGNEDDDDRIVISPVLSPDITKPPTPRVVVITKNPTPRLVISTKNPTPRPTRVTVPAPTPPLVITIPTPKPTFREETPTPKPVPDVVGVPPTARPTRLAPTTKPVPDVVGVPPTEKPTDNPTPQPTEMQTKPPTVPPSEKPTDKPTPQPTEMQTKPPTDKPVASPTTKPTEKPVVHHTSSPVKSPTTHSQNPEPTAFPTKAESPSPSKPPVNSPVKSPTKSPAEAETESPTPLTRCEVGVNCVGWCSFSETNPQGVCVDTQAVLLNSSMPCVQDGEVVVRCTCVMQTKEKGYCVQNKKVESKEEDGAWPPIAAGAVTTGAVVAAVVVSNVVASGMSSTTAQSTNSIGLEVISFAQYIALAAQMNLPEIPSTYQNFSSSLAFTCLFFFPMGQPYDDGQVNNGTRELQASESDAVANYARLIRIEPAFLFATAMSGLSIVFAAQMLVVVVIHAFKRSLSSSVFCQQLKTSAVSLLYWTIYPMSMVVFYQISRLRQFGVENYFITIVAVAMLVVYLTWLYTAGVHTMRIHRTVKKIESQRAVDVNETIRLQEDGKVYHALVDDWRHECRMFWIVKVFINGIRGSTVALIQNPRPIQGALFLVFAVAYFVLVVVLKPYKLSIQNKIAAFTSFLYIPNTILLVIFALSPAPVTPEQQNILGIVQITLNIISLIGFALISFVKYSCSDIRNIICFCRKSKQTDQGEFTQEHCVEKPGAVVESPMLVRDGLADTKKATFCSPEADNNTSPVATTNEETSSRVTFLEPADSSDVQMTKKQTSLVNN